MRLRFSALFLILAHNFSVLCSAQEATQINLPVHVRWIVDLKEKLGYENFERARSNKPWKRQQGIAFLTTDEVVVYQVKPGNQLSSSVSGSSPAAFYLQASILDTRDGHEIKSLLIAASSEAGKVMPLRRGAFLVQSGDLLSVYSSKFEATASRILQLAKTPSSQEWQIDVSPSGSQVIAVHQQAWSDGKGKETGTRADVEVLDSETLKTLKSFTVRHLDQWSAEDDAIIAADPEDTDGGSSFGIMQFNGKWRALRTSAENNDPDCPYQMTPLGHHLIVAHDCDDLVVVSTTGAEQFYLPVKDTSILISVAGTDHYLAAALIQPETSHVYLNLYDFSKKAMVSWVSLEKHTIYYAVSSAGTLVTVDGNKLKFFEPPPAN